LDSDKLQDVAAKTGGQIAKFRKSTVLTVSADHAKEACRLITIELPEFYHLSTITGVDDDPSVTLYYHFWQGRDFLTVKTGVPKTNPVIPSLIDILPAAILYEAEVKDLLGVIFQGNPLMDRRLLLPDNYPLEAPPPLRKEADPEKIRKMMELE
jgi:Ni,Fe-hydrogenase III component G